MLPMFANSSALSSPRVVWFELTSKCPVDCVFCSRKSIRGVGEHMPFDLFTRTLAELERPAVIRLSYSGESGHYPQLAEAIDAAKASGADVELVTALVSVPDNTIRAMAERLDRITISLHTTNDPDFHRIYRYGSFAEFERKLNVLDQVREERGKPVVDFCFVAMESNLSALEGVVGLARDRYVKDIFIQPVMKRESMSYSFPELEVDGRHQRLFAEALRGAVDELQPRYSGVRLKIVNPAMDDARSSSCGMSAREEIVECAEDPRQTVHIMSNGDVISCGWRQSSPLGNLSTARLLEIWRSPAYEAFRKEHRAGRDAVCRQCHFKKTQPAGPMAESIGPGKAPLRQMPGGWMEHDDGDDVLWGCGEAVLEIPAGKPILHLRGGLPPGPGEEHNALTILADGKEIAQIENRARGKMLHFDRMLALPPASGDSAKVIRFRTRHEYGPRNRGPKGEDRRLGFYLALAECIDGATANLDSYPGSHPDNYDDSGLDSISLHRLDRLRKVLALTDAAARWVGRLPKKRPLSSPGHGAPGMTIIIPERGDPQMLGECLDSVAAAVGHLAEPVQVLVVANGSRGEDYSSLRPQHRKVEFLIEERALSFTGAVREGLRKASYDWVYLLNNDMVLDAAALQVVANARKEFTFALASRIVLADTGSLGYETNYTSSRVRDGLFEVYHSSPPEGLGPFEILFGGGGCTLYRRCLLERYVGGGDPYAPFYFEDLEWATLGWRDGFSSHFCPQSVATHRHRVTINRFYGAAEAERIFQRNLLQYQLRHTVGGVSREAVLEKIAETDATTVQDLTGWRKLASIAHARLANARLANARTSPVSRGA
jgi:MoaA/NifB/PqqE/SkfB family radical SAM enzyme/GT2 family glycosyltransferase